VGKNGLNNIEDFLTNDRFISFVFERTSSLKEYWDDYLMLNPEKKSLAIKAEQILLNELDAPGMSSGEQEELKERILCTIKGF
jgi:hypothetical protein